MTLSPMSRSTRASRSARNALNALAALIAAAILLLGPPLASATAEENAPDDELTQIIDPDQEQGSGRVVLDDGHIDFGPTLNTGEWIVQIHDDTSVPRYWRMPEDVVAQVSDTSKLTIPDDDAYAFLGLAPGSEAWVIPQVREPGVIWTGWNTQEPNVLDRLNLGTTLRIHGVEGPGEVSVFLQSGNFGEPQPLWSTREAFPQESWIEVNTHTHANWVFSEPGVYLVQIEFAGELIDGTEVSATDTLRFAVGDETDPEAAFAAVYEGEEPGASADAPGDEAPAAAESDRSGGLGLIIGVVAGVIALAIVVAVVVVIAAGRRAKARARAARAAANGAAAAGPAPVERLPEADGRRSEAGE
ncbi:TIGR03773 family transporter-associated surface protein [Leucobacter weissii]|uniref:TIGR03773 family transporter-associated surface protein n=1 Tax=Leucobacter weissii TaxID=1983706 RepID=A0A939S9B3_9MICO|nr:TIGR03773 family transporter-associated surface protein [Leucobacter weissii]MBO1902966.1 TIGR03773 family transporter-associated surface protein [Leucobacter weissii]